MHFYSRMLSSQIALTVVSSSGPARGRDVLHTFWSQASKSVAIVALSLLFSGCSLIEIIKKPETNLNEMTFEGGKRIGRIDLFGLKYTNEGFIRRYLFSKPGDIFDDTNTEIDYARLDGLGIFSSIQFDLLVEEDDVVLIITVTEVAPWLPGISMSITDENGISAGPSVSFSNFLGRAMRLSASARTGGATSFQTSFLTPWYGDSRPQVSAQIFSSSRANKLDDFYENSLEANLDLLWDIGKNFRFGPRATFIQMKADTSGITVNDSNKDRTRGFGFFLGHDSRDFLSYPTKGGIILLDAIHYYGDFASTRTNVDIRWYISAYERHRLGIYSLTTFSSGELGIDIPIWADFHVGGTNTVRGWALGSRRGKNQSLGVIEYGYMILERKIVRISSIQLDIGLQLAVFGDLGTAWDQKDEFRQNMIAGSGVGARLIMPSIGMLRFDFAAGEPHLGIQVHLGGKERPVAQRYRVR